MIGSFIYSSDFDEDFLKQTEKNVEDTIINDMLAIIDEASHDTKLLKLSSYIETLILLNFCLNRQMIDYVYVSQTEEVFDKYMKELLKSNNFKRRRLYPSTINY